MKIRLKPPKRWCVWRWSMITRGAAPSENSRTKCRLANKQKRAYKIFNFTVLETPLFCSNRIHFFSFLWISIENREMKLILIPIGSEWMFARFTYIFEYFQGSTGWQGVWCRRRAPTASDKSNWSKIVCGSEHRIHFSYNQLFRISKLLLNALKLQGCCLFVFFVNDLNVFLFENSFFSFCILLCFKFFEQNGKRKPLNLFPSVYFVTKFALKRKIKYFRRWWRADGALWFLLIFARKSEETKPLSRMWLASTTPLSFRPVHAADTATTRRLKILNSQSDASFVRVCLPFLWNFDLTH